ncbi:MAG: ATP synthase F1 subunit delta [Lachnospiraceae bacterium]|mgnify:FL=1|jgi:F-type H+-transporting ATPase subunit delta|nr:ATP synthase F1 subunit delta [Lachnospiraceae bacterium]
MAKLASKVYGDALFQLAVEEHRVDEVMEEILAVDAVLKENPELTRLMEHPDIVKEEKEKLIENCFKGRVSDDVTGFLVTVVRKGRYQELPAIFTYLISQMKEYKKIGIAQVDSAMELSPQWKKKIEETLLVTTRYETMEITYRVDKSLLGGMVIRLGDRVVDSSLKHKLETLKGQLLKITLEEQKEGGQAL